ncbi:hypothetical protein CK203_099206 [Vitis vinifera]|uniref:Uncharacterized protein n=1 Tax=Vitis vinifera TaxID=29760 RepID=A0A438DMN0_VITVI|nr:hypothetical protein CK203_099206 [Vitis vinifera]
MIYHHYLSGALQKMAEQIPFNIIADVLTKLGLLGYLTN